MTGQVSPGIWDHRPLSQPTSCWQLSLKGNGTRVFVDPLWVVFAPWDYLGGQFSAITSCAWNSLPAEVIMAFRLCYPWILTWLACFMYCVLYLRYQINYMFAIREVLVDIP